MSMIGKKMSRKFSVLFLIVFILIGSIAFGEWWDDKPYTEWSVEQVDKILNDSPWVCLAPGAPPRTSWFPRSVTYVPFYFQVRLLTARPVRESLLRMISLEMGNYIVDSKEINNRVEYGSERLQQFLGSNPKDVIVQGDDQHIIVTVTLKKALVDGSPVKYMELTTADELSNIDISKIKAETNLATNTGRRVDLLGYVKPGRDRLGTKFYFPRNLADGRPLITVKDEELYFETRVNDTKIKAKFDLRKMLYKGNLEI